MSNSTGREDMDNELLSLANVFCESSLDDTRHARLETLLRNDDRLRSLFVEFIQLHGQLTWDAGRVPGAALPLEHSASRSSHARSADEFQTPAVSRTWSLPRKVVAVLAMTAAAVVILVLVRRDPVPVPLAVDVDPAVPANAVAHQNATNSLAADATELAPLPLQGMSSDPAPDHSSNDNVVTAELPPSVPGTSARSDAVIVAEMDRLLAAAWSDNGVVAAEPAGDYEWVRRLYLTVTGRIPTIDEVEAFVAQDETTKRSQLVQSLVDDPRTAENLAAIWTNLLIGRSNARGVDRDALFGFLRNEFAGNEPWMHTVGLLVSAEGRSDQNGATNFLLAHLNDQATPATAVTARLFLGRQVQCTQCHDHPFAKERTQQEFWSLNAFFKQTERRTIQVASTEPIRGLVMSLVDSDDSGMTFYDTLRGQQKAVLPEFAGTVLDANDGSSRRSELARLLAADADHQVARAMVNRMWAQFFGYGFTSPVDDLGPHNPPSHPELLEHLTNAFVESNYDLRRLMMWMATSEAYQLSGRASDEVLTADDPEEGGVPLFARIYPRPLGPEQVYESIRTAIRSTSSQPVVSSAGSEHRRQWVEQFVRSYGTDENDEQLTFEGNIAQALLMMNGEDLEQAIPAAAAAVASGDRTGRVTPTDALQRLSLATLNRAPTEAEEKVFRSRLRTLARAESNDTALRIAAEDMLWAYLNSSEFASLN